jgi:hypothetical protein
MNTQSSTGMVHEGAHHWEGAPLMPRCGGDRRHPENYKPTTEPVTCKRCLQGHGAPKDAIPTNGKAAEPIVRNCQECERVFEIADARKHATRYCSDECRARARTKQTNGAVARHRKKLSSHDQAILDAASGRVESGQVGWLEAAALEAVRVEAARSSAVSSIVSRALALTTELADVLDDAEIFIESSAKVALRPGWIEIQIEAETITLGQLSHAAELLGANDCEINIVEHSERLAFELAFTTDTSEVEP